MYDLVVIGAGIGGYTAAVKAAKSGLKTAIVEGKKIGGTCLNVGCIPTKYLVTKAHDYAAAKSMISEGLLSGNIEADYKKIKDQMVARVDRLTKGVEWLLNSNGVDIFSGKASFVDDNHISIDDNEVIETKKVIIATGSSPRKLDNVKIFGKRKRVFTSDDIFYELDEIPSSITIVGGGVIGLELAFIYASFGSKVKILESREYLFEEIDKDLNTEVMRMLHNASIECLFGCKIADIIADEDEVTIYDEDEEVINKSDIVLIAVGRSGNIEGLALEKVGVNTERGHIAVDKNFCTDKENIFAIGDVNGQESLAYLASAQGENVVAYIMGKPSPKDISVFPKCIYLSLDVAYVGMTSENAKKMGIEFEERKFLMSANGRSYAEGNGGVVKLLVTKDGLNIIGGICICKNASEIINLISQAVSNETSVSEFCKTVIPHPTYSEALMETADLFV